ncbi:MAG TPA: site-specific DNA-methyltransferase [Planctomycetes bacterium]|nr:site-specific DNA-methyltransferase [Planctomycetota bacterium]
MLNESTRHRVLCGHAAAMNDVADASIDLVVTSPPYPMVSMWDEVFRKEHSGIGAALDRGDGPRAFEAMHRVLDDVWLECHRVLKPGGLFCLNVGDATRKVGDEFRLYSNHARILQTMRGLGFSILPDILWRKPNNSPTKFMGSGMLPGGAYVTYEHEYILILRKGNLRTFRSPADKARRRRSAFFWEERNLWFSDLWQGLTGVEQELSDKAARRRSAAFPFELAYRLILMHSVLGDVVLDPFLGTGTTMAAAVAAGRESVGVEQERGLMTTIDATLTASVAPGLARGRRRLLDHLAFVAKCEEQGTSLSHVNETYGFPVMTRQEVLLEVVVPSEIVSEAPGVYTASHERASCEGRQATFEV